MSSVTAAKPAITCFHHISRECVDLEEMATFYESFLGFRRIIRPAFESPGVWMMGHGMCLHLFVTKDIPSRRELAKAREEHFTTHQPEVDHFAFLVSNLAETEKYLVENGIRHSRIDVAETGATQLFVFDPCNNLIELSNCAPPPDGVTCAEGGGAAKLEAKP